MPALGIIADDLTGAMDTANEVAGYGYETLVLAVPDASPPDASVVAVNTESRYATPAEAAEAVRRGVGAVAASMVYKKIDSTLRGNVGSEVAAALRAAEAELAVVAPAFPATDRETWDGVHTVDGTPVAETEFGADQNGPASSAVDDLFAAQEFPVERLDGADVSGGVDRVAACFSAAVERHDQPPIVVCDARTGTHLDTIATAGARFDTLFVGSGGLAAHIRVNAPANSAGEVPQPGPGTPLAAVGSVSDTTLAQLGRVPDAHLFHLDPLELLEGTPDAGADVAGRLDRSVPTVLTAASDRATVEDTIAAGCDRGLSDTEVGGRISTGLADVAAEACRITRPSGLLLSGGDVAVAGLRALDATTVSLTGATVATGVPVGRLVDGVVADTMVITKAGGFGEETTIINCLDILDGER
ncbi:membrane protein [Halobellus salinus]|uniref:Membrane protein n=1 Tax=Halobellus salinus TaxID=931585 RepID=A0A830E934_9EURY|nr:four-carbon acid sugar kinase family protein [Halobellus salinus]GGJ01562.1 membrane protein [Halobellus salinus]SMP18373.1 Uncharacterized conserved protein YgbK, DUF1537 family [Halobellus salinus]